MVDIQLGREEGPEFRSKDGLELVTDAYYNFALITYRWPDGLNVWHKNALVPLIIINSLVRPDHPLRLPEKDGINLYTAKEADGKTRLYIHLRQVQCIQQYIFDHGLADPKRIIQRLRDEQAAGDTKAAETDGSLKPDCVFTPKDLPNLEQLDISGVSSWIPLPLNLVRPAALSDIQEVCFSDAKTLKAAMVGLRKSQAHEKREARYDELGLTESQKQIARREFQLFQEKQLARQGDSEAERLRKAKEVADIDNNTEGPGLWRGPRRQHSDRRRAGSDEDQDRSDRPSGTGWGGFPIHTDVDLQKMVNEAAATIGQEPAAAGIMSASASKMDAPAPSHGALDETDKNYGAISEEIPVASDTDPDIPSELPIVAECPGVHFFHAQQALIIASQGGLATVLVQHTETSDSEEDDVDQDVLPLHAAMPIGRSLFVAFDFITWERDCTTILEIGYAATWWQEIPGEGDDKRTFEQARDNGHWIIQDHLLTKRNTAWRRDLRDRFAFGQSIPLEEKNIAATIKQTIEDLTSKAGGGPIYVVVHFSDDEHTDLEALDLKTSEWQLKLKSDHEEFPSYASPSGVGQTYVIVCSFMWYRACADVEDNAVLFSVLESDQEVSPQEPKKKPEVDRTEMFMEEVADILLADRTRFYGNSGNDAMYKLEVFLKLVGPTELNNLKELVKEARLKAAAEAPTVPQIRDDGPPEEVEVSLPNPPAGFVEFPLSDRQARQTQAPADDSDSEDDMIAGVFCRDSNGELLEVDCAYGDDFDDE